MAKGIRDKVAIIGMGCTKFGERWNDGGADLMVEAFSEAIEDAGIDPQKDIEAAWYGHAVHDVGLGAMAAPCAIALRLPYLPVTRVENACATGSEALRGACYAVASGAYDICLAIGVEKLKDTGFGGLPTGGALGPRAQLASPNESAPGMFAVLATKYFAKYGLSPEEGKTMLAKVSAKSHYNGARNPKAHLRREITVEQILNAPIIAWPLGLFDCCGVSRWFSSGHSHYSGDGEEIQAGPCVCKGAPDLRQLWRGVIVYTVGWDLLRYDYTCCCQSL